MKTLKVQLFVALALLVGAAIGYCARPSNGEAPQENEEAVPRSSVIADKEDAAYVRKLRKRIAELEKLLAARESRPDGMQTNAPAARVASDPAPSDRPRGNPREWMENLKKSDPARYAQMTNRMAQWRQRRTERMQSRLSFLSSVDTSRMSTGARKTHDELQECLLRREEIEEQLHQEDLTEEMRRDLMDRMRATDREVRRLNGEERKNLIEETAKTLGFDGEAVQEITATLQEVIEVTDGHGGWGPPPR